MKIKETTDFKFSAFQPRTIEITIESETERLALCRFSGFNLTIPLLIDSTQGETYSVIVQLLNGLNAWVV